MQEFNYEDKKYYINYLDGWNCVTCAGNQNEFCVKIAKCGGLCVSIRRNDPLHRCFNFTTIKPFYSSISIF